MYRAAYIVLLSVFSLSACSVGMALSGKREPNLSMVRVGATRGEVEMQLGHCIKTVSLPSGGRQDSYEYELGNKPSAGRAVGHGVLDLLTLGLWEIAGTPIEAVQGEKQTISITYDAKDRVVAVNQSPVSGSGAEAHRPPGNGQNSEWPITKGHQIPSGNRSEDEYIGGP